MAGKTKAELEKQIQELIIERDYLKAKVETLETQCNDMVSGIYWEATRNERNAGRKTILTDEKKDEIKKYRFEKGCSYREISLVTGVSIGLVHKTCNS